MNEEFLEFLWVSRSYYLPLETTEGEPVYIMNPGSVNRDGGPDLFNAVIRLDKTIWAGNIELHVRSSDWNRHGHQNDEVYDNVILHVVFHHDTEVRCNGGTVVPTVEMKDRFDPALLATYEQLMKGQELIPCTPFLDDITLDALREEITRSFDRKISRKKEILRSFFQYQQNDLKGAFFIFLFRSFGFRVNALPFELLAKSFDFRLLLKYTDQPQMIEALLFGQSGLLPETGSNGYIEELTSNHNFLKKKYRVIPIDSSLWKFLRMRPAGFPTVRLAQLTAVLSQGLDIYRFLSDKETGISSMESVFARPTHPFWDTHYTFDKHSRSYPKKLGHDSIVTLYTNLVLPFRIFKEEILGRELRVEERISELEKTEPEDNRITRRFIQIGVHPSSTIESQGMAELKTYYCDQKQCLSCKVGQMIIRRGRNTS